MKKHNAVVIGCGFSGLSAACFLAKGGYAVTVLEKNSSPGGRARKFEKDGFTFDMGPSWYWMPDVFERFFEQFGKQVSDYYELIRLNPSYRVFWKDDKIDLPANYEELRKVFNSVEEGSGERLDAFLVEAAFKYKVGMQKLVHKPGRKLTELLDTEVITGVLKLDVFTSMQRHVNKYFKSEKLRQLMEFPILFLGATSKNTPALYSLMNYADIKLGTWYPKGGMYQIVDAMYKLAISLGVRVQFNEEVTSFDFVNGAIKKVKTLMDIYETDVVLGSADYHYIEKNLLPKSYQSYSDEYWKTRKMAPSCLIYFLGVNKKLSGLLHHTLLFDTSFNEHSRAIYEVAAWPKEPLFYVSCTSKTDENAAPVGCENLFILIPVSTELENDSDDLREHYLQLALKRIEEKCGESIRDHIIFKRSYAHADFKKDYHAFKGNAYGLANTLWQTANLKPSIKSKKVKNLYFAGQLTVPGPGVPPAIISGEVAAKEIMKDLGN